MEKYRELSALEYLKLKKHQKLWYNFVSFILSIPSGFVNFIFKIGNFFKRLGLRIANECVDVYNTFKNGDWKTRLSFVIMGFGSLARGQILRGILFLLFEVVFILYMVFWGGAWLAKLSLSNLTATTTENVLTSYYDTATGQWVEEYVTQTITGDNALHILIYGVLTIAFIIAFVYTWRVNVKQNKLAQQIIDSGKKLKSGKQDMQSLLDDQFHKTILALPVAGISIFTVMPIIVMILVAFTNYDASHSYPNLFEWVGLDNFNELLSWSNGSSSFAATFGEVLAWTLIWAFFATFSNYFLGMLVAMAINKKGIKFKKVWRTILIVTIAVPQFISLLYVSKMFASDGLINTWITETFGREHVIDFWGENGNNILPRVMVILINIWVGIPYLMLITTGVLMNIPADLYESARIDGANAFQMYCRITLPYMLFVTGPYLLTSFTSNINNFNVIYLLTGGAPTRLSYNAGKTDLLITWLYKLTIDNSNYKLASVIGIMVFVVVALISLIVYNLMPSIKNEEDYQ